MTNSRHSPSPSTSPLWRGLAAWCALAVWLLGLMAVSPGLHGAVHHDAGEAGHSCAVTLFNAGVDDGLGQTDLLVVPTFYPVGQETVAVLAPFASVLLRLPPGCGPPLR